jgi:hypothetical membrane protein
MTMTRKLVACGAIGGPLFVVAFLVEGATRAGYSPMRHPVSSLALGDLGWTQTLNFIVTGLLMLAFAVGLRRALRGPDGSTWGPLLLMLYAVGLIGAGAFTTDPVSGYPPGTQDTLEYTTNGALHDAFSLPVFAALTAACLVFARWFARRKRPGWAAYSAVTGVVFLASFFLASIGFSQAEGLVDAAGFYQRVALVTGWTWVTLLSLHVLRTVPEAVAAPAAGAERPATG